MVFPVVINGCESWTIKKAEHWRIDASELWCWRRLLKVPWTARRSNQSILKEISPWTGRPGVLQSMGSQRVGHDWATELNWNCYKYAQLKEIINRDLKETMRMLSQQIQNINRIGNHKEEPEKWLKWKIYLRVSIVNLNKEKNQLEDMPVEITVWEEERKEMNRA